MMSDLKAAEVYALVRKLKVRARRTKDRDLARAGMLLRVLIAVITADEPTAELPTAKTIETGRLN
jgi:hypothetical protein